MVLHDAEAEKSFTAPFGCGFPYDGPSALALIRQGWQISLNAAFCVLHELCRPPKHCDVAKDRLRELVGEWAAGPGHPIKAPVLHAAHTLIEGTSLPWREGVELMKRVSDYDGQRAALAIAYFASDCDSPEGEEALTRTDADIREQWDARGI
jgi:hypothetical protein